MRHPTEWERQHVSLLELLCFLDYCLLLAFETIFTVESLYSTQRSHLYGMESIRPEHLTGDHARDEMKHEVEPLEDGYQGGRAPQPILTTASAQDPDVKPDIQFRAVRESRLLLQNLSGVGPSKPMLTSPTFLNLDSIFFSLPCHTPVVVIASGLFWITVLFTITVLNAFSRSIYASLGDSGKGTWVYNAFNIVTVPLAPILSYFSDIHGRVSFMAPYNTCSSTSA